MALVSGIWLQRPVSAVIHAYRAPCIQLMAALFPGALIANRLTVIAAAAATALYAISTAPYQRCMRRTVSITLSDGCQYVIVPGRYLR